LAVRYGGYPFGSWGAHTFFERAAQVGSVVVEFGELVARAVKAARWAVTLFELELAERLAESPYCQRWQHVCTSCYVDPFYNAYTPHLMLEDAFQI
jgi:hypothetical protein